MQCPSTQHNPMDTSDWLKAIVQEEAAPMIMDSSSTHSPSPDFVHHLQPPPPPPPMLERRLRPPHDLPLKCPRCDSTHTKFCYYNNYSLSQPRYFCKTCRRYWTKGGSLRNVPVGGGCRKNKRSGGSKKAAEHPMPLGQFPPLGAGAAYLDAVGRGSTELHLSTLSSLLPQQGPNAAGGGGLRGLSGFMDCKYTSMFDAHDSGEPKFGGILADPRGQFLLGLEGNAGGDNGLSTAFGELGHGFGLSTTFGGGVSPLGFSMEFGNHGGLVESSQRLALPWNGHEDDAMSAVESKPDGKMLSLEWQEQCGEVVREPFAYAGSANGGMGVLWGGVVNNHHVGSSAAPNQLV